jgi:hypothetical protein
VGRRSRKRVASRPASQARELRAVDSPAARRRRRRGEAPVAPWGKFPLVELCVLAALIIGVLGLVRGDAPGRVMLACAMALGSLAGLELAIREHFAGYKPHSSLLAGALAVIAAAILFFARAPQFVLPPVAAAVFGVAFWALRGLFKRRSGGLGYR